jgi:uncharacterized protein YjbI with pentapeptide repeats
MDTKMNHKAFIDAAIKRQSTFLLSNDKNEIPELSFENFDITQLSELYGYGLFLVGVTLNGANLRKAMLQEANISYAFLSNVDLSEAILSNANLRGSDLREAELGRAKLDGANLGEANLNGANLSEADLSKANLSWAVLMRADLYGANLLCADFSGATVTSSDLSNSSMRHAILSHANFNKNNMTDANLNRADLNGADLSETNMSGANLNEANLTGANLDHAQFTLTPNLLSANFTGTRNFNRAIFKTEDGKRVTDLVVGPDGKLCAEQKPSKMIFRRRKTQNFNANSKDDRRTVHAADLGFVPYLSNPAPVATAPEPQNP